MCVPMDIFEAAERGKLSLVKRILENLSRKRLQASGTRTNIDENDEKEALLPRDFKAYIEPSNSTAISMTGGAYKEMSVKLATSWGSAEDNVHGSTTEPEMFRLQEIISDLNEVIERQLLVARRRALAESDLHARTALVSLFF